MGTKSQKDVDAAQREHGAYQDALQDFNNAINTINYKSKQGDDRKALERQIKRLAPAFLALCGTGEQKPKDGRIGNKKPSSELKISAENSTAYTWGLCPACGKKCVKLKKRTVLIDFPMYCKHCKKESVVTRQPK